MVAGRSAEALTELERAQRLRPEEARESLDMEVLLLARLDRPAEAAQRLLAAVGQKPTPQEAVLYAQVARLAGQAAPRPPSYLVAALPEDPPVRAFARALAAAVAGDEAPADAELWRIPDSRVVGIARIHAAARRDPARTLDLLREAKAEVREGVDGSLALLMAGEALWRGDLGLARKLLLATWTEVPVESIVSFLGGAAEPPELAELHPAQRAALHAARARAARAAGRSAQGDERRALELDVLRGVPTNALTHWPEPRR